MGTDQDKVYIALGKNVEEGLGILRWSLDQWGSQPVSFVVLHIDTTPKSFVYTPFGKFPSSSVNDEMLEICRANEKEKVDSLLSKYMSFCCKVKAEVLKVDISEGPIHKILVGLISDFGIKKLVMGFKKSKSLSWKTKSDSIHSCYVQKHKPDFCELVILCGGKLATLKEEYDVEGAYFVDESGVIIADFRKKSKEKISFKLWLSRKTTDNAPSNEAISHFTAGVAHELVSNKWEDNAEEIERYVQCLEPGDEAVDQLEVSNNNMSSLNRTEVLRAIEQAEKMVEKKKCDAKAEEERRIKAEWIISLCNQMAEQIEANLSEENTMQANLKDELQTVRSQINEITENSKDIKSKLTSELDQQGNLMIKLQAYFLENQRVEAAMARVENERAEILRQMEETCRQRDFVKRRIDYYNEREVMNSSKGLNFRYREFSVEELRDATNDFSEKMVIASGSEGIVYKGRINHTNVAINVEVAPMKSLEEFEAQVELLRHVNHPNIVSMLGACTERQCIVFEHMHNGNLHSILFPSLKNHPVFLPWHTRIKIASNLLSAIGFLHTAHVHVHIHSLLDATHVLLDHNLTAKISGLCTSSTKVSMASDVYALGIIILQLITGREVIEMQTVRLVIEVERLMEILDQRAGDWPIDIATEFAKIGAQCCQDEEGDERLMGKLMKEVEDLQVKAEKKMVYGGDKCTKMPVPEAFLCPIFQEVMKEPYIAADGFSYELGAIKEWLSTGRETSPMTNLKLKNTLLTPNHALQCLIRDWHHKH